MNGDNERIWLALPEDSRALVDDLICRRHTVRAAKLVREAAASTRQVSINEALDVVEGRRYGLSVRGLVDPLPPPVTLSQLVERARAITDPVVAIEALWDGDTQRWGVLLLAIVRCPSRQHPIFDQYELMFADGRDAPTDSVEGIRTPQAAEAVNKGSALARELGVPFSFLDPNASLLEDLRWWDSRSA
ncbi:hypothetical protein [Actinoplanes xinjiangensis]|uniref:hypothetical protein n=1 Tax=Actinoplanes xinjiangensis TaxID=512350 RepID=UPI00130E18C2|nr:hypothetical protein [Actinoplanes xinjiangensis]